MVLYYYAFCVLLLVLIRPVVSIKICDGHGRRCGYAALYFLPITAMVHATCSGLICKIFLPIIHIIRHLLQIKIIFERCYKIWKEVWEIFREKYLKLVTMNDHICFQIIHILICS